MTVTIIICAVLAIVIIAAVLMHFGWSISTQHRDHGAAAAGPLQRRSIRSGRRPRTHAGPVNPGAIPGESIAGQPSDLSAGITEEKG